MLTNFSLESKKLLSLSLPLIISGVVETSVGFSSNLFLAHLGAASLAAGALVNWVFTTIMVVLWGTFSVITTLVARCYGEKNQAEIACIFYGGLLLAVLFTVPTMFLLWHLAPIFLFFGQKTELVSLVNPYLQGLSWAIIPDFLITILLQFLAGLGKTKANLVFSLLFVPTNIFFNYSLMFGYFGFPQLGMAGIGWGTALSFWIITLGFTIYFFFEKNYRTYLILPTFKKTVSAIKEIIRVGMPLGLMYFFEIGFFLALSLLMGSINQTTLTANQVALQFFGLFSIVTFALAQGVTIRVGHNIGTQEKTAIRYTTYAGVLYGCGFMLVVAILYLVFANELISIDFSQSKAEHTIIYPLAKNFLQLAALVQLIEAARFAFFGALRGLKDTRYTLMNSLLIFWVIAFPLGYAILPYFPQGYALWWTTLLGEIIGTLLLIKRYHRKVKKYLLQVIL